ncbi:VanZ family protein [Streptomyces sp. P38-E01]|uniref:VanZ family protein n=1 Tax=Streptomyces tardus TaxID=2780544 RepID=A0A949N524_9ACTN|nr:VanZ family protein [Streptomyces tardus]
MVQSYMLPVQTAATVFPLLAVLLFLPSAVVLYRRHGVLSRWRALSLCAFGYYLLTAVCLTLIPLPRLTPDFCRRFAAKADPEWTPGHTFTDIWREAGSDITVKTLVLQNPAVAGALFNLLLLLPLGLFLRYHFRRNLATTVALGFGLSLLFEATQGTALWGAYPCPYRLFDVDDLLTNTAGAALGWFLAGPLLRRLPSIASLDAKALARRPVPLGRRLTALTVDMIGVGAVTLVGLAVGLHQRGLTPAVVLGTPLLVCVCWFGLAPWATGTTPGKRLLRLELVDGAGQRPALWQLLLRSLPHGVLLTPMLAFGALVGVDVLVGRSLVGSLREVRADGVLALLVRVLLTDPSVVLLILAPAALMLLADEPNIRETIAFPLNGNAQDLLMGAPSEVDDARLRELHLSLRKPPPANK